MTDSSRLTVQKGIDRAVEAALPVLLTKLNACSQDIQLQAARSAEGLRACMKDQAQASGPTRAFQDELIRLIFGHADPTLVKALKEFIETVNYYLVETRDQLLSPKNRKDS